MPRFMFCTCCLCGKFQVVAHTQRQGQSLMVGLYAEALEESYLYFSVVAVAA